MIYFKAKCSMKTLAMSKKRLQKHFPLNLGIFEYIKELYAFLKIFLLLYSDTF